ncbi:DUF3299 domain-containing protein [Algoriphagus namhaensis]|uniref:DUF3299 domain-containing protein n=1 Tax=Algoriphagus namhaensis TaxID=915353 RepID=A0ABV8APE2_9BACT
MRSLIFSFLFLTVFTGSFAQEVKEIQWDDLIPDEVEIDDPFEKLTEDQIDDLRYIVRMRTLQERKPGSVAAESLKTIEEKEKKLAAEGVNVESILAQHTAITELLKKNAEAVVESLDGLNIRMLGYLLPLDFNGKNGVEFLLVPWVGACIHTPPPPANQIVFIKFDKGFEVNSLFAPVWVEGTLLTEKLTKDLYLADGESKINVGYAMSAKKIWAYKKK